MATLFFSYSHADEALRDQLEKHLSGLQRQGIITSWHDRRITAGTAFADAISENLEAADIVLLLVSPDFIASEYCYEREMKRALARQHEGSARVIPVILRPCDWHELDFGGLLATPTDGKPITKWPNIDEAFLTVVQAIKSALNEMGQRPLAPPPSRFTALPTLDTPRQVDRSSNLRIKKQFTDLDKDRFRHEAFEYIAKFFENSLLELVERNPGVDQSFRRIDANHFAAAAYRGGDKICRGSASIGGGMMGADSIAYSMTDEPRHGSMNESVSVKADDQALYFEALGMQSYGRDKEKLTMQGAAELFWALFIRPLQG